MGTFHSIDELIKTLDREKVLLKEMFAKRHSLQFRYDYALEMTEYKEERIRYLIENGVIRDTGDCLEMEDVYQKFFEDVLEVNEEINVSSVRDYISVLNENIDYYLKENNESRKYKYLKEVRRCLKTIALATVRNVLDLKRNMDNTYKNEPNYEIKKAKLQRLSEKLKNISQLITESERVIDTDQPVFFSMAMDVRMKNVVNDVRLQLNESYHNLLEIERQIIQYLNMIDYQNRIFEKVKKLKYLKDQFRWEEATDVRQVIATRNAVWMEPHPKYYIKLSIDNLRTSDEALQCISILSENLKKRKGRRLDSLAEPIPDDYLKGNRQKLEAVSKWIDYLTFLKTYNSAFGSGLVFSAADIVVRINCDMELKDLAGKLFSEKKSYDEIVEKLISELERMGFVEQQDEVEKTWKVLASFHYIEELIDCISITDDTDITDDADNTGRREMDKVMNKEKDKETDKEKEEQP